MTEKPRTRVVEIDFEIHQMIELEKRGFDESDNDALRRLLRLPEPQPTSDNSRSWSSHGVTLPHGTELRMNYGGQEHTGIVDNGKWLVGENDAIARQEPPLSLQELRMVGLPFLTDGNTGT